ncbi:unnamed protein product [Lactuca virosa]|uniref:Uncharacterized protein n=1 Tax=Lactuca virosa TaxID=75947 RepID=A0AAU9MRN1_9ASTR|nr:unnamed protein product [Lactuca virosa]
MVTHTSHTIFSGYHLRPLHRFSSPHHATPPPSSSSSADSSHLIFKTSASHLILNLVGSSTSHLLLKLLI